MSIKKIINQNKWTLSPEKLSTIYYSAFLMFWLIRLYNNLWLFQQLEPPVFYTGFDFSFQLLDNFNFIHFISQSKTASFVIDILLFSIGVSCLIFKDKKILNILFSILLISYIFIHYGALGAHKHNLTGLWFTSLIFWYKKGINFALALRALRYYAIYAYASAAFWKFYRDSYSFDYFFSAILKSHNALFMHSNPNHLKTQIVEFLLNHASIADLLFQLMTIGELAFILALFTIKFDKYLAYFAISFHLVSLFIVNIYFLEFTLVLLPFLFKTKKESHEVFLLSSWKNAKVMFAICLFFIASHIYYIDNSIKTIKFEKYDSTVFYGAYPIQNYMMYSYAYHSETFDDYHIYVNGNLLIQHNWLPIKSEQFEGNIMQFEKYLANNAIDSQKMKAKQNMPLLLKNVDYNINLNEYKTWILNKTAALTNSTVDEIEIYKVTFKFENNKSELIKKERVL